VGSAREEVAEGGPVTEIPDDVRQTVEESMSDDEIEVLEHLVELGPTTDTVLAEELDAQTSTIRRALYELYEHRIADYEENRDEEKGWLTFVWDYTPREALRELDEARREAAREIREEIERARNEEIFACPRGHTRAPFGEAMDLEFHCPRCGGDLEREDTEARVQALQDQLETLQQDAAEA
jgi:transcription initiation factor TFIIE subunit alpha